VLSERVDALVDLLVDRVDHAAEVIDVVEVHPQHQRVVLIEAALQREAELTDLGAHPGEGHLRHHRGVALAGHERVEHPPRCFAEHVRHDRVELDPGVLEQLRDSLGLAGPVLQQLRSIAGEVPQTGDLGGRHEAAAQQPALQQLASHTASATWSCGSGGSSRGARCTTTARRR